ncbi:MAG: type II toxin-antitoxin system RelE/ParE family toxin [Candidatus Solibacter usitatus]|nr:type II toxin-antitoxin system RelE/ParE family toxin [Candidatus Solibacter usitatus]
MIKSFRSKDAEALFLGRVNRRFTNVARVAQRKLHQLAAARALSELTVFPGNRLERLFGDRSGQYSIRINDQLRICFRWNEGDAYDVEIIDYH